MEVFIKDEDKDYIFIGYKKNKKYQIGLDMETRIDPITKSLDQHDLEIRAYERKKVREELEEWVKKYQFFIGDCVCIADTQENIYLGEAIDKLAKYKNTGLEPIEVKQLKHDLAVRDKALELSLKDVIRYPVQLCMKEYWLEQAEKELKGEK